jgi:hypothetical protein
MVRTTPPKEKKVPTTQALVAQPGSKVPNDNLTDDGPKLLNFDAAESEIICQTISRLQMC